MVIYNKLSEYIYDCSTCPTRCDSVSKGVYNFHSDAEFSESYERSIIDAINDKTEYSARKSPHHLYPDIEVSHPEKGIFYIEIKVQRRAFMQVAERLPLSNLTPSNALALNKSDLLRYFDLTNRKQLNIYIMWVLLERPCIIHGSQCRYFYQTCTRLQKIYAKIKNKRTFVRKTGYGDVVNGQHKGVIVNYHFAINELKEWKMLF